jgi:hypothetical protein
MTPRRALLVLPLAVALATAAPAITAAPAAASVMPRLAPPALDINIFGSENEPNESEPNENENDNGTTTEPSEADHESDGGSAAVSPTVLLVIGGVLIALAVVATVVAIRVLRRIKRWTRTRADAAGRMWEDIVVRVPEVRPRRRPPD